MTELPTRADIIEVTALAIDSMDGEEGIGDIVLYVFEHFGLIRGEPANRLDFEDPA